jgi:hypothetical protein
MVVLRGRELTNAAAERAPDADSHADWHAHDLGATQQKCVVDIVRSYILSPSVSAYVFPVDDSQINLKPCRFGEE